MASCIFNSKISAFILRLFFYASGSSRTKYKSSIQEEKNLHFKPIFQYPTPHKAYVYPHNKRTKRDTINVSLRRQVLFIYSLQDKVSVLARQYKGLP